MLYNRYSIYPFNSRNIIIVFILLFGSILDIDKDRNVTAVTVNSIIRRK